MNEHVAKTVDQALDLSIADQRELEAFLGGQPVGARQDLRSLLEPASRLASIPRPEPSAQAMLRGEERLLAALAAVKAGGEGAVWSRLPRLPWAGASARRGGPRVTVVRAGVALAAAGLASLVFLAAAVALSEPPRPDPFWSAGDEVASVLHLPLRHVEFQGVVTEVSEDTLVLDDGSVFQVGDKTEFPVGFGERAVEGLLGRRIHIDAYRVAGGDWYADHVELE